MIHRTGTSLSCSDNGYRRFLSVLIFSSPGSYQRLDLFMKVLRVLCPNLTDDLVFKCMKASINREEVFAFKVLIIEIPQLITGYLLFTPYM